MTNYTAAEVERALIPLVGGYFGGMTEEEEQLAEEASENDRTWAELEGTLKGSAECYSSYSAVPPVTHVTVRGEQAPIELVEDHGGGEGQGEERWIVIRVGGQLFRKSGYYASHYGSEFDGDLEEVQAVVRPVTFYEPKEQ